MHQFFRFDCFFYPETDKKKVKFCKIFLKKMRAILNYSNGKITNTNHE